MKKATMRRRLLSILLSLAMIISMFSGFTVPVSAATTISDDLNLTVTWPAAGTTASGNKFMPTVSGCDDLEVLYAMFMDQSSGSTVTTLTDGTEYMVYLVLKAKDGFEFSGDYTNVEGKLKLDDATPMGVMVCSGLDNVSDPSKLFRSINWSGSDELFIMTTVTAGTPVEKTEPTADMFTVTDPEATFDGTAKAVSAAVKDDYADGMGDIYVRYYDAEGNEVTNPRCVGTYTVQLYVSEGKKYKEATLTDPSWTLTIKDTEDPEVTEGTPVAISNAMCLSFTMPEDGDTSSDGNGTYPITVNGLHTNVLDLVSVRLVNIPYAVNKVPVNTYFSVEIILKAKDGYYFAKSSDPNYGNNYADTILVNNINGSYWVANKYSDSEAWYDTQDSHSDEENVYLEIRLENLMVEPVVKADMYDITGTEAVYDGNAHYVTAAVKDEYASDADNSYTVHYYDADGKEVENPVEIGTYTVKLVVQDDGGYYNGAVLSDDSWTLEIKSPAPTADQFTITDSYYDYDGEAHGVTVTGPDHVTDITAHYYDADGNEVIDPTDAGIYDVQISAVSYGQTYVLSNDSWNLIIEPKVVQLVTQLAIKSYGQEDPGFSASVYGLVGDDTLNYTLIREEGEDVGKYEITAELGENPNYDVRVISLGQLVIVASSVTLATMDDKKIYGESDPTFRVAVLGQLGDDPLEYTVTREEGENVGEYQISIELGDNPNYEVDVDNSGKLTIVKREVTLTTEDAEKTYGDADPTFSATANDLVGDDTLDYTLTREEGEDAGEYQISAALGDNPNYEVDVENSGKLTITKKDVTLTTEDAEKTYGDADPTFSATADGLVGDDTLDYTFTREEGEDAGEYQISAEPGENANYNVTVNNTGKLTIGKKGVTLTTENAVKTYGQEDPAFSATVEGLVGEDALDYSLSRVEGEDVGKYQISATLEKEDSNYDVTINNVGNLTIEKYENNEITSLTCENINSLETPEPAATAAFGEITYTYSKDGENWDTWENTYDGVGTYYVKATVEDTDNYNGCESVAEFTVDYACKGSFILTMRQLRCGTYEMYLNDTDAGLYTFQPTVCGYTIQNTETGEYVCLVNGQIVMAQTDTPTVWAKDCTGFHADVFRTTCCGLFRWCATPQLIRCYLSIDEDGNLTTSGIPAVTHFTYQYTAESHTFDYVTNEDGTHTGTCIFCGYTFTENCAYDETNHCTVCGGFDMTKAGVQKVEVNVDQHTVEGGWYWNFIYPVYVQESTTYIARIAVFAEGTDVAKVEYSLDGETYTEGTTCVSENSIDQLWVRTTDGLGKVAVWAYADGETTLAE